MKNAQGIIPGLTAVYQVSDRKRTRDWYAQCFGFELVWDSEEIGFCELKSTIDTVFVGLSEVEKPSPAGGATLTWGTEDIDEVRSRLEGQGVRFDGATRVHPGIVKLATLYDPDGNAIMLYQSLSEG